jgi:hypothetical protein
MRDPLVKRLHTVGAYGASGSVFQTVRKPTGKSSLSALKKSVATLMAICGRWGSKAAGVPDFAAG